MLVAARGAAVAAEVGRHRGCPVGRKEWVLGCEKANMRMTLIFSASKLDA